MLKKSIFIVGMSMVLGGCATIMGSPTQTVPISSTPSEAKIMVKDEAGVEVFSGQTPTSVTLNKSTGRYFGGKTFTVTISKPGFKTQSIPVVASPNGWYIGGNIIFGGLIGWLIVDPLNGNMYSLSPEAIASSMPGSDTAHNNRATDGTIAVMLMQDVPQQLREKLVQLH
ncbi:MAG: hypothetical protein ACM3X0_08490 [Bacteroidota bacterium]